MGDGWLPPPKPRISLIQSVEGTVWAEACENRFIVQVREGSPNVVKHHLGVRRTKALNRWFTGEFECQIRMLIYEPIYGSVVGWRRVTG